jgi:hypothetical protein
MYANRRLKTLAPAAYGFTQIMDAVGEDWVIWGLSIHDG